MFDPVLTARYRALLLTGLAREGAPALESSSRVLVVDVARQRLGLIEAGQLVFEAVISTARNGLGCEEGSYRTPTGWHRIHARIGAGAEPGSVFRNRVATGEVWRGEAREEDLILTRVLTLDGQEEGWNRGPGRDSLERFIYMHGTNQEGQLGTPVSHGCVRLGNAEVLDLFDRVAEGDLLLIAEGTPGDGLGLGRLHFAGVGGSGMSALAQFVAMKGGRASGSDRSFDRGERTESRAQLEALGVAIHPQNGSGLEGDCSALVVSTAVEEDVPDVAAARRLGVPVLHRSELLAHLVARYRTVAVTGTSGKSSTVAMIFEILRGAGRDPSIITGGDLVALQRQGLWGNAWAGASDLLVIEADESDGSVVRYHAAVGVLLNLQRDHKEMEAVAEMFRTFRVQVRETAVVGEAENLRAFAGGSLVFGFGEGAQLRTEGLSLGAESSAFRVRNTDFRLPVPGRHNVENALAAIGACMALGVPLEAMVEPLSAFQGVARRFQVLGTRAGVTVVDDFGHNPAKVAASIRAAHLRLAAAGGRLLAVFQPHGFGPLKFLRADFVESFSAELRAQDRLWFLDVFYAGGTAAKDISSGDVIGDLVARGVQAEHAPSRKWLVERLAAEAREGDLILIMGARDPSLTDLAKGILAALPGGGSE
ncbi:L,D-transpeptidase family protein [Geothrix sp. PMB-07]|uniref:L,D-transpeptidase family protein n=1 Tax=Geothrix sp. PMB-07 TaxID=3068640 RepID=UPI00274165A3|nr:L,D-transpeptidase family protein [Geothrix sp. PMB-07]WLT32962.1 Mur ligase domain-containing protein [Geothrix sp. PMB-07]